MFFGPKYVKKISYFFLIFMPCMWTKHYFLFNCYFFKNIIITLSPFWVAFKSDLLFLLTVKSPDSSSKKI